MHVMRNSSLSDNTLLTEAVRLLEDRLPPAWRTDVVPEPGSRDRRVDAIITLRSPDGGQARFVVEVKQRIDPVAVPRLAARLTNRDAVPVVVAPFLSPRTRELLKKVGVRYIDLTGNVWLTVDRPALFVESSGAERDPRREERPARSLKGAKAGRIIRALCDYQPPVGVRKLAERADADAGYVSRILVLLEREALIDREPRGPVVGADWQGLIRRWAADYSVLKSNRPRSYLDPRGLNAFVERLRERSFGYAVTGSLGASRLAPVAPAALAMCYVDDPERASEQLDLLPTDAGANVMLIEPFDEVVYERTWGREGLTFAAPSQVAVDLLTSPGRGPSEAEALLTWMAGNEDAWRS